MKLLSKLRNLIYNLFVPPQSQERAGIAPNFYTLLEVRRSNSALEIRQAYKKISKKLHPDRNPSKNAELEFQRVKYAYDVSAIVFQLLNECIIVFIFEEVESLFRFDIIT